MGKDVNIDAPCANLVIRALPPKVNTSTKIIRKNDVWVIVDKEGKETPYSQEALLEILNRG